MLVAFSVTPLGVGEAVAEYVADAVKVVRDSGLPNRTDAMFTTIEGEWDEVMAVVKQAVDAVAARAPRVSINLKADVRPGVTDGLLRVGGVSARAWRSAFTEVTGVEWRMTPIFGGRTDMDICAETFAAHG